MGNTVGVQESQHHLDLSIGTLDRTRTDDKEWLGVAEENLFNEAFTNEKYYSLRSRNTPRERTSILDALSPTPTSESSAPTQQQQQHPQQYRHKLSNIIEDDANETLSRIAEQLSNNSFSTAYFETVLQKRLTVLQRIHLAYSRERAREKLSARSLFMKNDENDIDKKFAPSSLRMTVQLFITFIKEQKDKSVSSALLQTLRHMIYEIEPLSLKDDDDECINRFIDWLMSVVTAEGDTKLSLDVRRNAMESLLILVLARGSLKHILSIFSLVVSGNKEFQELQELYVMPAIKRLAEWKIHPALSTPAKDRLSSTWTIGWNDSDSVSFMSSATANIATIASDGSYLYLHDACGLVKIGTGHFGTIRGRVYLRISTFEPQEKCWLACIQKKLYFRCPTLGTASIAVLDTATLNEEGKIYQDEEGHVVSYNGQFIISAAVTRSQHFPATSVSQPSEEKSGTNTEYNKFPMFSDGRYLYMLVNVASSSLFYPSSRFYVEIYDPLSEMQRIKRIELTYPELKTNQGSPVLPISAIDKCSIYSNGHYLIVVLPPPFGTAYGYNSTTSVCRLFNLANGHFVGNHSDPEVIESPTCYDYINNVIWNYSSKGAEVGQYDNEGIAPKHTFPVEDATQISQYIHEVRSFQKTLLIAFSSEIQPSLQNQEELRFKNLQ